MIAIVGAGITGLALAHHLEREGVPHVVLEAAARPGGVIRSGRVEGHLLEWGPQRTRRTRAFEALVAELGLGGEVISAPGDLPLWVYSRGRLRRVPYSVPEFLRTDLLGPAEKLRLLAEPFTAPPRDDESVATLLSRKVGRRLYERMLGPLYGGLYASDPADMVVGLSLGHVLREFGIGRSLLLPLARRGGRIQAPPAVSFREGMQTLPLALHRRHAARVRLGTPVRALSGRAGAFRVALDGETLDASRVVITTPAPAAADLLRPLAPDAAARLDALVYNPLAVVHLHADAPLHGLGYQVALDETLVTRGVTFNDSLFGRRGVYTAYLGGARNPDVVGLPDDAVAEAAVREFRTATGANARPLAVARERMPAWDRSWAALAGLSLPEGVSVAANWESRPGLPGRFAQAERLAARLASGFRGRSEAATGAGNL